MDRQLPTGTVTFLFTDIEGSTSLLHDLGAEAYADALGEHRRALREAFVRHGGVEVDTQGDAFFVAFPTAPGALTAADEARQGLTGPIRVRIGLHTGTPLVTDEGYVGTDVHRAARIAACGHGGQILVSSSTAALVDTKLRDLGVHRLKDLSAPERIYQLGDHEFPPLNSLHQTNLPIAATPFLGREKELGEVLGLLSRDDVRLLTLTGPGGTGKTRLGAQAAAALAERYPHGVWWIPLAPLRDPALVVETAAQTLGAQDGLVDHIADKSLLLLFDNFEHLVDAAGDVASVLESCPNLEVLVTSREPLHVTGEQEYAVPPFVHEEGVGFFLARARAIDPTFQVDDAVPEICRRLDDLPLALELAAARTKALSTLQILERLEQRLPLLTGGARDLPERQRTLRATIEWSYELLAPDEQQLFARLAVFRGGCTLDAAEQIADADLDPLQSLVDKSLVRHTQDRYWMLETIREFAADELERSGETQDLAQRHANYFLSFCEGASVDWRFSPGEWPARFDRDHDNFRRALDSLAAEGEDEKVLRLASALWRFWQLQGHRSEGKRRLEAALGRDTRPSAARAHALNGLAVMYVEQGDGATARPFAEEALAINEKAGDTKGAAFSRFMVAQAASETGDSTQAAEHFQQSRDLFLEIGDENYALLSSRMLAGTFYERGDLARAREMHERHLRWAREIGNRSVEGDMLYTLADYALEDGRLDDARLLFRDAVDLYLEEEPDLLEVGILLRTLARFFALQGETERAVRFLSASEKVREEMDFNRSWFHELTAEDVQPMRSALGDDAFEQAWRDGHSLTVDEGLLLARDALED